MHNLFVRFSVCCGKAVLFVFLLLFAASLQSMEEWMTVIDAAIQGVPELAQRRRQTISHQFSLRNNTRVSCTHGTHHNYTHAEASYVHIRTYSVCKPYSGKFFVGFYFRYFRYGESQNEKLTHENLDSRLL